MSDFSDRFNEFINYQNVTPYRLALNIGASEATISNYRSGKSKPTLDFLSKLLNYYKELDLNWLVNGEGEMIKPNVQNMWQNKTATKTATFSDETKNIKNVALSEPKEEYTGKMPQVVTVDKQGKDNVILVPNKAAAGYIAGYGDKAFIKTLPTYSLPNISNGTFRMFQVAGDSMEPTIQNQSYVVGEWKENWNEDIKDGRVYVFVIQSTDYEGILIKRALNKIEKYGNVLLKSDNIIYPTKPITPQEIKEVWEVKLYLSFNIPDPSNIYDRMNDLEADIEYLKDKLKGKN